MEYDHFAVADPDFPDRAPAPEGVHYPIIWLIFVKNVAKNKL